MPEIKTEFLFTIAFEVQVLDLGDTPYGNRRIVRSGAGTFEGPKMKGAVLPGGGGWSLVRHDSVIEVNMRVALETDDKHHVYMKWSGFRHGPYEVIDRLDRGETVDPALYYFRITPYFETSSQKYEWINRICSIATGFRKASTRGFDVFQVL